MAKQLYNEEAVRKSLSLGGIDSVFVDTLCNLREAGRESWEHIGGLCCKHKNIDVIAQIIEAVTESAPSQAEQWFDVLLDPIKVFLNYPEHHPKPRFGSEYVLGFTKGIFKASNWYDENYFFATFVETPLVEKFSFFNKYFLMKNSVTEKADELLQKNKFAEKYESQLSGLIKTFVRYERNKGARMSSAVTLVQSFYEKARKESSPKDNFSRLGLMIFDQISYALFGSISTCGRARAITAFNKDILSPLS